MVDDLGGVTTPGVRTRLSVLEGPPGQRIVVYAMSDIIELVLEIKNREGAWVPAGEITTTYAQVEALYKLLSSRRNTLPP